MSESFQFQEAHDSIVSMLHDYLAEKEHAERLEAENAHLKAEVERLNDLANNPYRLSKGWQPIETAPKDGDHIIGWSEDFTSAGIFLWTCLHQWDDPKDVFGWVEAEGDWSVEYKITHWMPLPKPPTK